MLCGGPRHWPQGDGSWRVDGVCSPPVVLVSRHVTVPARATSSESSLRRSIGTFALAASIVNVTIGAGIFRLPADMAAALGPTAPIAYLLCAIAMGLIAICLAEAGSRVSLTGGPMRMSRSHSDRSSGSSADSCFGC